MDTERSTLIVKLVKGDMMDGTAHEDRPPAPALRCRCCGGELEAIYQKGLLPGRDGYYLVTCWKESCTLSGYTLSARDYTTRNLTSYGLTA